MHSSTGHLEQSNLAPVLNKGTDSERFNTSESRSESDAKNQGSSWTANVPLSTLQEIAVEF